MPARTLDAEAFFARLAEFRNGLPDREASMTDAVVWHAHGTRVRRRAGRTASPRTSSGRPAPSSSATATPGPRRSSGWSTPWSSRPAPPSRPMSRHTRCGRCGRRSATTSRASGTSDMCKSELPVLGFVQPQRHGHQVDAGEGLGQPDALHDQPPLQAASRSRCGAAGAASAPPAQRFACSAALSPPHVPLRGRASIAPVCELRRNSSPSAPDSSRAFTTSPSGRATREPAVT